MLTDSFPCVSCGICCKNLHPILYADIRLPTGICKHYDEAAKSCSIYETRPITCRIDDFYTQHLKDVMDKRQYIAKNANACMNLMLTNADYENYTKMLVKSSPFLHQEEE